MNKEEIQKIVDERGWASLTRGQKDIFSGSSLRTSPTSTPPAAPTFFSSQTAAETILPKKEETLARIGGQVKTIEQQALEAQKTANKLAEEQKQKKEEEEKAPVGISAGDIIGAGGSLTDYEKQADNTYLPKTDYKDLTPQEIETQKMITEMQTAKQEYQDEVNKLKNLDISKDPTFQSLVSSITSQWEIRRRDMERANTSRQASLRQMGIRTGSRYTEAVFGGIISAEETAASQRISDLEAQKQSAIVQAQIAYQSQKWSEYSDLVDLAEKNYNKTAEALTNLQKITIEENKKREEANKKTNIASYVSLLTKQGITNPSDILIELNKLGIMTDAEELKKATDLFIPDTIKEKENIGKIYQSALNMGAPQDVIDNILNSETITDAYKAAGKYAQNVGGEIGQYNYSVLQGFTGTLDDWLKIDANRKAKAAATIDVSGMTSKQNQVFNSISDKLRNSPLMKANDRTIVLKTITDEIKKNPENGALQLSLIYSFIQALDTYQSAVREGEIGLTQSLLGWMGKLEIYKSNIEEEKKILDSKTSLNIANSADLLVKTIKEGAKRTENDFKAQAKINGIETQWDEYRNTVKELNKTPIEVEAIQIEENAQQDIQNYGINNPTAQDSIKQMIKDGKSYLEIKELLGI